MFFLVRPSGWRSFGGIKHPKWSVGGSCSAYLAKRIFSSEVCAEGSAVPCPSRTVPRGLVHRVPAGCGADVPCPWPGSAGAGSRMPSRGCGPRARTPPGVAVCVRGGRVRLCPRMPVGLSAGGVPLDAGGTHRTGAAGWGERVGDRSRCPRSPGTPWRPLGRPRMFPSPRQPCQRAPTLPCEPERTTADRAACTSVRRPGSAPGPGRVRVAGPRARLAAATNLQDKGEGFPYCRKRDQGSVSRGNARKTIPVAVPVNGGRGRKACSPPCGFVAARSGALDTGRIPPPVRSPSGGVRKMDPCGCRTRTAGAGQRGRMPRTGRSRNVRAVSIRVSGLLPAAGARTSAGRRGGGAREGVGGQFPTSGGSAGGAA
jgi:hypothetical protein